jgi:chromosome segregation ATPase
MDEETFNNKLQELIQEIATLPADQRKRVIPLIEETKKRHQEIKDSVGKLEKSFAELRIYLKYLLFDLEATQRERDQFKQRLNQRDEDG